MTPENAGEGTVPDMAKMSAAHGVSLLALAVGMWVATGPSSMATLVPAVFGAVLLGLGILAWARPDSRKHAMHAAAAAALLGLLGTFRAAIDAVAGGPPEDSWAGFSAPILATFLWLCVRSFRQARKARG